MSQNETLTGCLAKTGQDQHLKSSPQSHNLFLSLFLTRNSKPPIVNIHDRNSSPPRHSFFYGPPPFKNFD